MSLTASKALGVTAVLVICLCIKLCMKHRKALIEWLDNLDKDRLVRIPIGPNFLDNWIRYWEFRKNWKPRFLSAPSVSKRIEEVRRNPASVAGTRRKHSRSHQRVMDSARESVAGSGYFRRLEKEEAVSEEGEAGKS